MGRPQRHALGGQNHLQRGVPRQKIHHHAVMRRVEVQDQHKGRLHVAGHRLQQRPARLQPACGCADGNNWERRTGRLTALIRHRVFPPEGAPCPSCRTVTGAGCFHAALPSCMITVSACSVVQNPDFSGSPSSPEGPVARSFSDRAHRCARGCALHLRRFRGCRRDGPMASFKPRHVAESTSAKLIGQPGCVHVECLKCPQTRFTLRRLRRVWLSGHFEGIAGGGTRTAPRTVFRQTSILNRFRIAISCDRGSSRAMMLRAIRTQSPFPGGQAAPRGKLATPAIGKVKRRP